MKYSSYALIAICVLASGCAADMPEKTIEEKAAEFCGQENVVGVEICGDYIKVISSLLGGGAAYYKDSKKIECPVVSLEYTTEECKGLTGVECRTVCKVVEA